MKRLIFLTTTVLIAACGQVETNSQRSGEDTESIEKHHGSFQLAGVNDYFSAHPELVSMEITITGEDFDSTDTYTRSQPTSAKVLKPGAYTIDVATFNSDGTKVRTGTAEFEINSGETTNVEVALFLTDGQLEVTLVDGEDNVSNVTPTVHAIGVYESSINRGFREHPMGDLTVTIRGEGPVILLFGSYEPTNWIISADPGVEIVEVVALGYHRQQITGIDDSLTTTGCYEAGCDHHDYAYFYSYPSTEFSNFFNKALGYTDLDGQTTADSVQADYNAQAFTISL